MQFFIQHWHCIFPLAGVIVAIFLFRSSSEEKKRPADDVGQRPLRLRKIPIETSGGKKNDDER